MRSVRAWGILAIVALVGLTAACGAPAATGGPAATGAPPAGSAPAASGAAGNAVDVTLQEWAVSTTPQSAQAGDVTFNITNSGPEDAHEFVIIRTDLSLIDLPTDDTGAVNEEAEGLDVIDEAEEIDVGDSDSLTVALEPGAYVLICNIYDEEEQESHYQEGMRTQFTVN
jgi:uncharacterized cupredoxin-like copper-binding protein